MYCYGRNEPVTEGAGVPLTHEVLAPRSAVEDDDEGLELVRAAYPALWATALNRWLRPGPPNQIGMLYASSYLVQTGGTCWAIDPILPSSLIPDWPAVDAQPLRQLSFVLLTHAHSDHFDGGLLAMLAASGVALIVPDHMLELVRDRVRPARRQVLVARSGIPLTVAGVDILPFDGFHKARDDAGTLSGIESTGYYIVAGGRNLVFPGDARHYDPLTLPDLPGVPDYLFAHLWLGRGAALAPEPPLLDAYGRFVVRWRAKHIYLAHLHQVSRPLTDRWTERHVEMVRQHLKQIDVPVKVEGLGPGQQVKW